MNGAGIGGGHHGSCNNITINSGSVNAKSMHGAGIGSGNYGSCNNITIKSGSVTASSTSGAGIGGGLYGSCNNITISGGSVNAQVGCTPHQNLDSSGSYDPKSPEVYLCVIPNTKTKSVAIDNKVWEPSNHKAVESTNTNLYAWLTGEDHLITVEKETKSYIFNSNSGTFSEGKRDVTSDIFEFNGSEFTYDGNTHSPNITTKNNIKGVGNFTVKYFKEDNLQAEINEPKDVGTYIVKITAVEEGDFYNAYSGYLTNDNWKFAINLTPTITTYKDEYDGNPHPVISIEESTIPPNSIIEYSVDNGQTWYIHEDCRTRGKVTGSLHLLPSYDEYLLGYKDRTDVLPKEHYSKAFTNNGLFYPIVLHEGQVIGNWDKSVKKRGSLIEHSWFRLGDCVDEGALDREKDKYIRFWR